MDEKAIKKQKKENDKYLKLFAKKRDN